MEFNLPISIQPHGRKKCPKYRSFQTLLSGGVSSASLSGVLLSWAGSASMKRGEGGRQGLDQKQQLDEQKKWMKNMEQVLQCGCLVNDQV